MRVILLRLPTLNLLGLRWFYHFSLLSLIPGLHESDTHMKKAMMPLSIHKGWTLNISCGWAQCWMLGRDSSFSGLSMLSRCSGADTNEVQYWDHILYFYSLNCWLMISCGKTQTVRWLSALEIGSRRSRMDPRPSTHITTGGSNNLLGIKQNDIHLYIQ